MSSFSYVFKFFLWFDGGLHLHSPFLMLVSVFLTVRTRGWTKVVDSTRAIGPYAHKGNQWYSYDDPFSVAHKAEYIRSSGYGGAMVWDLSLDDHLNLCCREPMPLLRSINRVLRTVSYPDPRPGGGTCGQAPKPPTPPPPKRTTTYASGELFPSLPSANTPCHQIRPSVGGEHHTASQVAEQIKLLLSTQQKVINQYDETQDT